MKKQKQPCILSRADAAKLLSISLVTLRNWTTQGLIPSYQLGGRVYYKQKELLAALKLQYNQS